MRAVAGDGERQRLRDVERWCAGSSVILDRDDTDVVNQLMVE